MAKRKLSRKQAWRIEKIQEEKRRRAQRKAERQAGNIDSGALGPEQPGLITANFGATVDVEGPDRQLRRCAVRRNLEALVVGDRVVWQAERDSESGVVVAIEPRKSLLARPDAYGHIKPLAANVDQILVVTAPVPAYDPDLIDQYLAASEQTGIRPVIVLNKIDLLDPGERARIDGDLAEYRRIGYSVIHASTRARHGLEELLGRLAGRSSVFAGQSGVGKSSLIQTLLPQADIRVGEVAEQTGLGRHTTSVSQLYHLPDGAEVIDSPGVREFRLWGMDRDALAHGFAEFRPFLGTCRFRDCRHEDDPGCALREAAENGRISPRRLESFHRIAAAMEQGDRRF